MTLMSLVATLALMLAAVGIYGVISYAAAQRTHEIGIRMALGARPRAVLNLVARQGRTLALSGVGRGLVGAFWLTRLMSQLLFRVSTTDGITFICVPLFLILIAAIACYIP